MMVDIINEETYALGVYSRRGLTLVRGENAFVWDAEGKKYIDCIAGHGSANIGHANPAVATAIAAQAARLLACSNVFYNDALYRHRCRRRSSATQVPRRSRLRSSLHGVSPEGRRSSAHSARFTGVRLVP
jgi:4-aminobutyrate aminotransferase-like enzyme